jgi:hypothetical protein
MFDRGTAVSDFLDFTTVDPYYVEVQVVDITFSSGMIRPAPELICLLEE